MRNDAGDAADVMMDEVDPDIRRFQEIISADYARFGMAEASGHAERRAVAEKVRERWAQGGPEMAATRELVVPGSGVRIRIHRPVAGEAAMAGLIYIHGGGWTLFSLDSHDRLMREYAARAGVIVIGVDYAHAPEARFPTQIEQIQSVVDYLRRDGATLGIDAARLAIGGDSVGANMSVATNLALRARGEPVLAAMLLSYGAFGPAVTPSFDRYGGPEYMLNAEEMEGFWSAYITRPEDLADPLAVPLAAPLHDLPPSFFTIAECDILADGSREMAARLEAAGNSVSVASYPGTTHSFLEAAEIAEVSRRALADASAWLRSVLAA